MTQHKQIPSFDYLFIGLGAANCLMLRQLSKSGLLKHKKIAIIEPSKKDVNDRTFCFWSTPEDLKKLHLEDLVSSSWDKIRVNGIGKQSIAPLRYYHIKGISLYNAAKQLLAGTDCQFYTNSFNGNPTIVSGTYEVTIGDDAILAEKVFDSRPPKYSVSEKNQSHLFQSFYGWEIESIDYSFDTQTMVMMDFEIPQNDSCQFMYILPFTEKRALFEVTRFGKEIISKEEAQRTLEDYLNQLSIKYRIIEDERGVIPMSSSPIEVANHGNNWIHTGSRANMVKPSTGYAFYSMANDAYEQAQAIQKDQTIVKRAKPSRFEFYDRLLLKILEKNPSQGKNIFQMLLNNVPITEVLSFLSEKTNIQKELYIFSKLPIRIFIETALKDILYKVSRISPVIIAMVFTLVSLLLYTLQLETLLWVFLGAGFLTIGLSHGAIDHLTDNSIRSKHQLITFILKYILKGVILGTIWLFLPDLALFIFIAYSAWHFGQADFQEWKFKHGSQSFFWGLTVILIILFSHFDETLYILEQIPGLRIVEPMKLFSANALLILTTGLGISALGMAFFKKSKLMLLSSLYLILSSMLPLLVSFGIYFVIQHSLHGWEHLKSSLNKNSFQLWKQALPFTLLGALVIAFFIALKATDYLGVFFILLSCISIPHILSMDLFYKKNWPLQ